MLKTIVLLIELVLTITTFFLLFNLTTYAMLSYQQVKDTASQAVDQFQQDTTKMYGDVPTGYMPAASSNILSTLINFRI
jgi:hypothetical protein